MLADRAGVPLGSLGARERAQAQEGRLVRGALGVARDVFHAALSSAAGRPALDYLRERGFEQGLLERFDIGWVPPDFGRALRSAGADAPSLDKAGFTGAFGGRLAFGIRDGHGGLVGFGARRLGGEAPDAGPKYVNTRETRWFNKGRLLYGLDKAGPRLARTGRLVVMEGYTDVMMAHQVGLDEAVATMGTSLHRPSTCELVKSRVTQPGVWFSMGTRPGCDGRRARPCACSWRPDVECRACCPCPEARRPLGVALLTPHSRTTSRPCSRPRP